MVLAIVVISYVIIILFDYIPIIRKKNKKETIIYTVFLTISFVLLILTALEFDLPSPTKLIEQLLKPIVKK